MARAIFQSVLPTSQRTSSYPSVAAESADFLPRVDSHLVHIVDAVETACVRSEAEVLARGWGRLGSTAIEVRALTNLHCLMA